MIVDWITGILISIVGSAIFLGMTWLASSFYKRTKYWKNVDKSNKEILKILIQTLSEGIYPNQKILESIIQSTAVIYKIRVKDLKNVEELINDMIKEVFESNFISYKDKNEISIKLVELKETYVADSYSVNIEPEQEKGKNNAFNQIVKLGVMSLIVYGSLAYYLFSGIIRIEGLGSKDATTMLATAVFIVSAIYVLLVWKVSRKGDKKTI
ncbi:hypothetical protein [Sutcliffiella rhizosphaerae]|uniref:Uncharacterized protein n=1 Tax=Sutcliffiella rhizosphaerae TaxID=2880967 RepID=A0ABM8YLQ0_9BACI|nr:hypothetical protein [Sutcliffiella rhizosphaerae]CAG9620864.1 hypothetical protein BACCIP111883_01635 [Sutcliffiella rhizosphaerae]